MSFLAPFYLLATLGVAAPIVLHLIRRQPKGEVEFSSLMFLEPTPPRLTRRSRLENLPLLLLRCLVIAALALAFARPFLPSKQTTATQESKPAVILLVDRSASMRREGLWDQAIRNAKSVIDKESSSLISVVAFDREPALELSLENAGELSADSRQSVALQTIEELEPTWLDTNLGAAIRFAADHAARFTLQDEAGSGSLKTRIVLISDLQSGAEIDSLQGYEWPDGVWLELQSVRPQVFGNLSLRVLRQSNTENREEFDRDQPKLKVRVKHASDGQASIATLRIDEDVASNSIQLDAGTSKVTLLNLPETVSSDRKARVQLSGDQDDFDNKFYFIRPVKAEQRILFVGTATERQDTRESLALFAEQIPWSDATRRVSFETSETVDIETSTNGIADGFLNRKTTPFCIVEASGLSEQNSAKLKEYVRQGGRALVVLDRELDELQIKSLSSLLDSPDLLSQPVTGDEFRLISSVDFDAPIIEPLTQPGTGDFSTIRVWGHQKLTDFGSADVILGLDDRSPLLLRRVVMPAEMGDESDSRSKPGVLWVLTAGWQPSQSQLALSTKFVPLLLGMLGPNRQVPPQALTVGDPIQSRASSGETGLESETAVEPGFVRRDDGLTVAVNLAASESETSPMDPDRLDQLGVVTSSEAQERREKVAERSLRDQELESQQAWWQWLILATLGFVGAETILAARQSTRTSNLSGDSDG